MRFMIPAKGTPLGGGNLSTSIVRVGDTARRPIGHWTPAVHALLLHLEKVGFEGAPRVRGIDKEGREILTYLPGKVASGMPPHYAWSDATLAEIAHLVRRYHDAVSTFVVPPDAKWQLAETGQGEPEFVCHNDIAPWNTVFRNKEPVALIDWDLAGPGSRIFEICYALWHFVPLYDEKKCVQLECKADLDSRARRVRRFFDAYGLRPPKKLIETIQHVQWRTRERIRVLAEEGNAPYVKLWKAGAGEGIQREMAFVEANAPALARYS